jgi:hypothetical protein
MDKSKRNKKTNKGPQNCWEFWNCPKDVRNHCRAYEYDMGKECWLIASSFYKKGCPKTKDKGLLFCIEDCPWFKKLNPNFPKNKSSP